jgi:hypothetical protein
MPKEAAAPPETRVRYGPRYRLDIKQYPHAEASVNALIKDVIRPACQANPVAPHEHGAGTPIVMGTLTIRVPDTSSASGDRGGFRLLYHWRRTANEIVALTIGMRRDQRSFTRQVVAKLLEDSNAEAPPATQGKQPTNEPKTSKKMKTAVQASSSPCAPFRP